jgi:hypothetical protein
MAHLLAAHSRASPKQAKEPFFAIPLQKHKRCQQCENLAASSLRFDEDMLNFSLFK